MSSLLLLITLAMIGIPLSDSFSIPLASGSASRSISLQRRAVLKTCSRPKSTLWLGCGAHAAQTRTLRNRNSGPFFAERPGSTSTTLRSCASHPADPTADAHDSNDAEQTSENSKWSRQKSKRLREHVPITTTTEDEPTVIDGNWEGAGPWVGSSESTPTPLLGEPTYQDRAKFEMIMNDLLGTEKEEELPSRLSKHFEFLLSVDITRLTNDMIKRRPTMDGIKTLHTAYDFMVTFLEGMVENTLEIQRKNRELLKDLVAVAKIGSKEFEAKMTDLQKRFTYDFVKYLDAEISRLEKGDKTPGPGGDKEVLNVVKIVRMRVCAQLDLMLGEDVAVLTRLLSYDDRYMMRAALRAVLQDKKEAQLEKFSKLVYATLKDVDQMPHADRVLRHKLVDMVDDVDLITREVKKTNEEIALENAEKEES